MNGVLSAVIAFYMQAFTIALDCNQIRTDNQIKFLNWGNLEECVIEIGKNRVDKNSSENIWRLIKNVSSLQYNH